MEHLGSSYDLLPLNKRVILSQDSLHQYNITSLDSTNFAKQVLPTNRKLFLEEGKNDVQLMEILDDDSKLEEESLDKENARKALEQLSLSQSPPPDVIIPPPETVDPLTDVKESTEPVPVRSESKKKRRRGSLHSKADKNSDNSDESDEEPEEASDSKGESSTEVSDSVNQTSSASESAAPSTRQNTTETKTASDTTSSENASSDTAPPVKTKEEVTSEPRAENKDITVNEDKTETKADNKVSESTVHENEAENKSETTSKTEDKTSDNQRKAPENKSESPSDTKGKENAPSSIDSSSVTPVKSTVSTGVKQEPAYQTGKVDFTKIRDGTFEITHPILITGTANEASFDKLYTVRTSIWPLLATHRYLVSD